MQPKVVISSNQSNESRHIYRGKTETNLYKEKEEEERTRKIVIIYDVKVYLLCFIRRRWSDPFIKA